MTDDDQIQYLEQNIREEEDFKKFYREEKLIEVLSCAGEKYSEDLLYCFQPEGISDKIFQQWCSDSNEFIYSISSGAIFPNLIPLSTNIGHLLLFSARMGDLSSHDFYYFYNIKDNKVKKCLIHVFNEEDCNDEIHLFYFNDKDTSNSIELIDEPLAHYLKLGDYQINGRFGQRRGLDLIREICDSRVTSKSKLLSHLSKTIKLLPKLSK